MSTWFDNLQVFGKLPPAYASRKLRNLTGKRLRLPLKLLKKQKYLFFETCGRYRILAAHRACGQYPVDSSLKNSRIKITLDRLRVAAYPGGGTPHPI